METWFLKPRATVGSDHNLNDQELGFEAGRPESEIWLCHTVGL